MESRLPASWTQANPTWNLSDINEIYFYFKTKKMSPKFLDIIANWRDTVNAASVSSDCVRSDTACEGVKESDMHHRVLPLISTTIDILLGVDNPGTASTAPLPFNIGETVRGQVEAAIRRSVKDTHSAATVNVFGSAATGLQMQSLNSDVDLMVRPGPIAIGSADDAIGVSEETLQRKRAIVAWEDDLTKRSVLADSLCAIENIIAPIKKGAKGNLKLLTSDAAPSPVAPEGNTEGGGSNGPTPRRPRKKLKKSSDTRANIETLLHIIERAEESLRVLAAGGASAIVAALQLPEQLTAKEVSAERKRLKALKEDADEKGGNNADKAFIRSIMNQLKK